MNDAVDRLIIEREAMDHGFQGGLLVSAGAHLFLIGLAIVVPLLLPRQPPLRVVDGFAAPMPPGGAGSPSAQAASAKPQPPNPQPPAAKPEPPPKFIKPPSRSEPKAKGLPVPDAKKPKKPARSDEPERPRSPAPNPQTKSAGGPAAAAGSAASGTTPGLEFGPPGPGVPAGTDWLGDWYLAGVQRKIWSIWVQQIKAEFSRPITVQFTILQDGSLGDVTILETSGATLLDLAAKRAIYSAAPFGPLPKSYATTSYTIQAVFRPSS